MVWSGAHTNPSPSAVTTTVPTVAVGFTIWVSSWVEIETSSIPILTAREDVPAPRLKRLLADPG